MKIERGFAASEPPSPEGMRAHTPSPEGERAQKDSRLPYAFARSNGVIVQQDESSALRVALREDADPMVLIELRRHLGRPFTLERINAPAFDELLGEIYAYDGGAGDVAGALAVGN
ncbi:MAG: hypothetical protein ACRCSO_01450, partial [Sphingomonas sp.]